MKEDLKSSAPLAERFKLIRAQVASRLERGNVRKQLGLTIANRTELNELGEQAHRSAKELKKYIESVH